MRRSASLTLLLGASLAFVPWAVLAEPQEARAVLLAVDRAVLAGELAAQVKSLPRRPGVGFKKGDKLVELECALYRAQAEKVEAEHKAAAIKLQNVEELNQLRSIGALEVALARSELAQSQAELKIAHLNIQRCRIEAPFDGRVVALLVNRFENVEPQQRLLEIVSTQKPEVEVVVPATWLAWLKPGQTFSLQIDETGRAHQAQIETVSPVIDPVSQTLTLRAQVTEEAELVPGMSATARFDVPPIP